MADGERQSYDEGNNEPMDPEMLYTKEFCIGGGSFGKVFKGCVCPLSVSPWLPSQLQKPLEIFSTDLTSTATGLTSEQGRLWP